MRPRGLSISSPQSTYVGQVGRQNPQWTQSPMSAGSGGWCSSKAGCTACRVVGTPSRVGVPTVAAAEPGGRSATESRTGPVLGEAPGDPGGGASPVPWLPGVISVIYNPPTNRPG